MEINKDKEAARVKRQFNKILKQIPEDKKPIGESLIKELSFMAVTLDELKEEVTERGTIDLFKQGSQEFLRENPALKAYNTTVQRYSLLYKQLTDLLPKTAEDSQESALYEFIKGN